MYRGLVLSMTLLALSCGRTDLDTNIAPTAPKAPKSNAKIRVYDFQGLWSTSNNIHWFWEREGLEEDFDKFVLHISTATGDWKRVIEPKDAMELGTWTLPNTQQDPVRSTIVRDLQPNTSYNAFVVAFDKQGRQSMSGTATIATLPEATGRIVIFEEQDTRGYSIPATFELSNANAYSGTWHYRYISTCNGATSCYEVLRRQGTRLSLGALPKEAFDTAFFEFALSSSPATPSTSYWNNLRVKFKNTTPFYDFTGWSFAENSKYQVIQIPLRWMFTRLRNFAPKNAQEDSTALTDEVLLNELNEIGVGGRWADGAIIDWDDISLRWVEP